MAGRRFSFLAALGALAFGLFAASRASGYVRSISPHSGKAFVWTEDCIVMQADARGSQDVSIATIDATLAKSAMNWSTRTDTCSNLRISTIPHTTAVDVAADNRPVVVFRDKVWARPGGMMHDPAAIGLTTVMYVNTPGQNGDATILDADVELNGVNYTFTTDPAKARPRPGTISVADLENTLTHELGHVQGLAHTCFVDDGTTQRPLDDQGGPVPDCSPDLPSSVTMTTMYPYALSPAETTKRTLAPDDQRGICDVYPSSDPPKACYSLLVGGACAEAPARPREEPGLVVALLGLLAGALFLRRARA